MFPSNYFLLQKGTQMWMGTDALNSAKEATAMAEQKGLEQGLLAFIPYLILLIYILSCQWKGKVNVGEVTGQK